VEPVDRRVGGHCRAPSAVGLLLERGDGVLAQLEQGRGCTGLLGGYWVLAEQRGRGPRDRPADGVGCHHSPSVDERRARAALRSDLPDHTFTTAGAHPITVTDPDPGDTTLADATATPALTGGILCAPCISCWAF